MLRVRWLGRVAYRDAHALQRALFSRSADDHLLLLEHPHVFTLGVRGRPEHVLVPPASVGAELIRTDRGGDVTYHGPGQLVGYPILSVPTGPGATPAYVAAVEQVVIDALAGLGLPGTGRLPGYPGVWVDPAGPAPAKICAIGVRLSRGRSMHGFALNVHPDLAWFARIVPCGLAGRPVTSLADQGVRASLAEAVEAVTEQAVRSWGAGGYERQDVAGRAAARAGGSTAPAPVPAPGAPAPGPAPLPPTPVALRPSPGGVDLRARKPPWLRAKADMGPSYRSLRRRLRGLDLVTVCEEAGCPNIFECWADGTATFMINGSRCTRACAFCLVDTARPGPLDPGEPGRVAEAVAELGLAHAVVTAVARDDLGDGGAAAFAATVVAIRDRCPGTAVEVLIPDCKGSEAALANVFETRPDVLNHNVETVPRLQRAVRPSASYARSLSVLARAKDAGLITKSGMVLGMGETEPEVLATLADLRAVGVDILTLGQYLRPTAAHLPVARWWRPEELQALGEAGRALGFAHVEASPLTRSSYHARAAAASSVGSVR